MGVTDWGGHIDVLVVAGIIILVQVIVNIVLYKKITGQRSIIYYGETKYRPYRHDSPTYNSGHRIDRVGTVSKK